MAELRAAIDCGTNSTRLLIIGPGGETLERRMHITRLGQGVDATGKLHPLAIARTLDVLEKYAKAIEELGGAQLRITATSAARDASNAAEFLDPATKAVGSTPEILTGDEEGALSFLGATASMDIEIGTHVVVVDVGGGSTELATGAVGSKPSAVRSLPLGCVRVTERYFGDGPTVPSEVKVAYAAAETLLRAALEEVPDLRKAQRLVAVAGTATTLAAMELGLVEYDPDKIHGTTLTRAQFRSWLERLSDETPQQRAAHAGIEPARAGVILGGVIVWDAVLSVLDFAQATVSEADILDGLAASMGG